MQTSSSSGLTRHHSPPETLPTPGTTSQACPARRSATAGMRTGLTISSERGASNGTGISQNPLSSLRSFEPRFLRERVRALCRSSSRWMRGPGTNAGRARGGSSGCPTSGSGEGERVWIHHHNRTSAQSTRFCAVNGFSCRLRARSCTEMGARMASSCRPGRGAAPLGAAHIRPPARKESHHVCTTTSSLPPRTRPRPLPRPRRPERHRPSVVAGFWAILGGGTSGWTERASYASRRHPTRRRRRIPFSLSGNGRWVAFVSAEALVPEDDNGVE